MACSIERTPAPVPSPLAERLAAEAGPSRDGGQSDLFPPDAMSQSVPPHRPAPEDALAARSKFLTGIPAADAGSGPVQETRGVNPDAVNARISFLETGSAEAGECQASQPVLGTRPMEVPVLGPHDGAGSSPAPVTPPRLPTEDRRSRVGEDVARSPFVLGDRSQSRSLEAWSSLRSPRGQALEMNSRTSGSLKALSGAPLDWSTRTSGSLRALSGVPLELSGRHSSIHEQVQTRLMQTGVLNLFLD